MIIWAKRRPSRKSSNLIIKDCVNSKRLLVKEGSHTASLWLQYMKMVNILRQFIKAERTRNRELHLQMVKEILPYLAAVILLRLYLQTMADLPNQHPDIYQRSTCSEVYM
jgi:hypothetical protein